MQFMENYLKKNNTYIYTEVIAKCFVLDMLRIQCTWVVSPHGAIDHQIDPSWRISSKQG